MEQEQNPSQPTGTDANTDYKTLFEIEQKRRRGSQSAYSKLAEEKKAVELELSELRGQAKPTMTREQTEHLESLKFDDPDAYYEQRRNFETIAAQEHNKKVEGFRAQAQTSVRAELMVQELNDAELLLTTLHPDFSQVVNKESLENNLPPVVSAKFKSGEETAEEFLTKAYAYLSKDKKIKSPEKPNQPNLGRVPGSTRSSNPANQQDFAQSYASDTF